MRKGCKVEAGEIHAVSVAAMVNGRFLLVRRLRPPSPGLFAFPGGRVEAGEGDEEAARRELLEETRLTAGGIALLREMTIAGDGGERYRLRVYRALEVYGTAVAGDDADHVGWYTLDQMRRLPVTASTLALAEEIVDAAA